MAVRILRVPPDFDADFDTPSELEKALIAWAEQVLREEAKQDEAHEEQLLEEVEGNLSTAFPPGSENKLEFEVP